LLQTGNEAQEGGKLVKLKRIQNPNEWGHGQPGWRPIKCFWQERIIFKKKKKNKNERGIAFRIEPTTGL